MTASSKYSGGAPSASALEHYRTEIRCLRSGGLGPDDLNHVWLLVNSPHFGGPVAQRKGELAGPAGQIQPPASPGDLGEAGQIAIIAAGYGSLYRS